MLAFVGVHPSSHPPRACSSAGGGLLGGVMVLGNFRLKGFYSTRHPKAAAPAGGGWGGHQDRANQPTAAADNMLNRVTSQFIKCIQHIKCTIGGDWYCVGPGGGFG